ncbi:hypothetical protein DYB32_003698 [Aphanomyces invadans]|uniref:Uncharacterized protein n=1 Tax=Aphanomyces invadans TaxID=157072 RepID=A0A3R6VCT0_9STRA|nr:hypothetical protein DYB32_003698 [Aphanomyces invadans]
MSQQAIRAQNDYIFNLQVQADKYARLISSVNVRIHAIDDEWKSVREKLAELRLKRNEGRNHSECKLAATNTELKKKIDGLRASRLFSQSVFEKNQKKLRDIQRQMQETFKQSTLIMAERDKVPSGKRFKGQRETHRRAQVVAQAQSLSNMNMEEQDAFDEIYQNLAMIITREKENAGNSDTRSSAKLVGTDDHHKLVDLYTKKEEENFALFRYVQVRTLCSVGWHLTPEHPSPACVEYQQRMRAAGRADADFTARTAKVPTVARSIAHTVGLSRYSDELKEGSANMRKRLIESLEETRQKFDRRRRPNAHDCCRILRENAEYERLRQSAQREFGPIARAVDKLYNSLGCNEMIPVRWTQFLSTRIIEQRSNDLVEQFTRRLQHKNPQNLATTSLGAHLQPSDPNRANGLHLSFNLSQAPPLLHASETNGETDNTSGDEDDSLVPVSTAELQRKAAKSLAQQLNNAKGSPTRNKKKKQK